MKLFIIFLLTFNLCYAENSVIIKKGEEASFDGYLVKKGRVEELIKAEKKSLTLEKLRIVQDDMIEYYKEDAKNSRKKLTEAKWNGFWENTGYFLIGCIITSVAFKVNQEIQR